MHATRSIHERDAIFIPPTSFEPNKLTRTVALTFLENVSHEFKVSQVHGPFFMAFTDECIDRTMRNGRPALKLLYGSTDYNAQVFVWQALSIVSRSIAHYCPSLDEAKRLFERVWPIYEHPDLSPNLRFWVEVFLSHLLRAFPEPFMQSALLPCLEVRDQRPTLVGSLVVVVGLVVLDHDLSSSPTGQRFLQIVCSKLSSNYGHIRTVAQYFFYRLYPLVIGPARAPLSAGELLAQTVHTSLTNDDVQVVRARQDRYVDRLLNFSRSSFQFVDR